MIDQKPTPKVPSKVEMKPEAKIDSKPEKAEKKPILIQENPITTNEVQSSFMRDTAAEELTTRLLRVKPIRFIQVCCSTHPESLPSYLDIIVEGGIRIRIEGHFTVLPKP
jgi:hypothetical protein